MLNISIYGLQGPKGAKGQKGERGEMGIRGDPVSILETISIHPFSTV